MQSWGLRNQRTKVTDRETYRFPASPYRTVMENSRKFDAKINLGAGFAPMQIAYQQKDEALESLKMQSRGLCNQRTKSYGPGNLSVPSLGVYKTVMGNSRKLAKKINHGARLT